eukprot:1025359-Prorocentrum_lima.AAC.1
MSEYVEGVMVRPKRNHAVVPIGVAELGNGTYSGPVVENKVPALLGLRTLESKHCIIDIRVD